MLDKVFSKKKYIPLPPRSEQAGTREALAEQMRCPECAYISVQKEFVHNENVCPDCKHHFPMKALDRIELLVDGESFVEIDRNLQSVNILDFPGYEEKLAGAREQSGLVEAVVTGKAAIGGYPVVIAVMDARFMMGSMGSVVGEKICRAAEKAMEQQCPLIICTASGGARMQEGMISLMQMAKTSAVLKRFHKAGLLYISILTNPTTGGVSASFASLADIIIAEPGALIGFAGPRVIAQTIGQKLPAGFQCSEFLLEHGQVDLIVSRSELRGKLEQLLRLHQGGKNA